MISVKFAQRRRFSSACQPAKKYRDFSRCGFVHALRSKDSDANNTDADPATRASTLMPSDRFPRSILLRGRMGFEGRVAHQDTFRVELLYLIVGHCEQLVQDALVVFTQPRCT